MFRRDTSKTESSLRFCQHSSEIDALHLFYFPETNVAVSKVSDWYVRSGEGPEEARAYGILDTIHGVAHPVLPIAITFDFSTSSSNGKAGRGSVRKVHGTEIPHYRCDVIIYDADRTIFSSLQACMEHAAISRLTSVRLQLARKPLVLAKGLEAQKQQFALEQAKLKEIMRLAENDPSQMPGVEFDSIAIKDDLVLAAPSWRHEWHDGVGSNMGFEAPEMAAWRGQSWRPLGS